MKAAMSTAKSETLPLLCEDDVVRVRRTIRAWMVEQCFSLIEQTKMVTAASELGRNVLIHGGGGLAFIEGRMEGVRYMLQVSFTDQGAGIADIEQALRDGYSTGNGLGLGLGGAKRLAHRFEIVSEPGRGTRVTIAMLK